MSMNLDSDIDSLIAKLDNLCITDNNEIDNLCNKFSNLIVACPESERKKYYEKISNILSKMLHKKRCVDKYQMYNIRTIF